MSDRRREQFLTSAREWLKSLTVREFDYRVDTLNYTIEMSPIEKLVADAFLLLELAWKLQPPGVFEFSDLPQDARYEELLSTELAGDVLVWPQCHVGKYRADFVIRYQTPEYAGGGVPVWAAIECDGHDYHERTKEQAQHDKERDRYFQASGLLVLRYTGSEIWRDPLAVAGGAVEIIKKRAIGQL